MGGCPLDFLDACSRLPRLEFVNLIHLQSGLDLRIRPDLDHEELILGHIGFIHWKVRRCPGSSIHHQMTIYFLIEDYFHRGVHV